VVTAIHTPGLVDRTQELRYFSASNKNLEIIKRPSNLPGEKLRHHEIHINERRTHVLHTSVKGKKKRST